MVHKWIQTVSHSLCSKTRPPLTFWLCTNGHKQWTTAWTPKQDTTHILMAHKWTQTLSHSLCSKARDSHPDDKWTQTLSNSLCSKTRHHSHPDSTQMDPNSEPQLMLQSRKPLTSWWHKNGPKQWATACAPKQDTHILMVQKWTWTVNHSLWSKQDTTYPLQMDPNDEPQFVLQSKTPLTTW